MILRRLFIILCMGGCAKTHLTIARASIAGVSWMRFLAWFCICTIFAAGFFGCVSQGGGAPPAIENCLKPGESMAYFDSCLVIMARDEKNPAICSKIVDPEALDLCFSQVAGALADASLCQNITGNYLKENCIESVKVAKRYQ